MQIQFIILVILVLFRIISPPYLNFSIFQEGDFEPLNFSGFCVNMFSATDFFVPNIDTLWHFTLFKLKLKNSMQYRYRIRESQLRPSTRGLFLTEAKLFQNLSTKISNGPKFVRFCVSHTPNLSEMWGFIISVSRQNV